MESMLCIKCNISRPINKYIKQKWGHIRYTCNYCNNHYKRNLKLKCECGFIIWLLL
jgi:redox-regulated HSP33 family molecular chaperone